ncbi:MAG: hypothetical protein ACREMJ_09520 [Gemmatimonadales bacterium]
MNLTLLAAVVMLLLWIVLAIVLALPAGWVHGFYAAGWILLARRVVVGAPQFRS